MTAVPTPAEEAVARVLANHIFLIAGCACGWGEDDRRNLRHGHAQHVAGLLLDSAGPVARLVREERVEALREAALALWSLEGPDLIAGANDAYGDWLDDRADREEQG